MFRLLLDEHLYPGIPDQVRRRRPRARIESLTTWNGGRLLEQPDERILREARGEGWMLLTYDLATIPSLLAEMARLGESHAGVIFVSRKSFAQNDHGGLVKALVTAWPSWAKLDWTDRVEYLRKG